MYVALQVLTILVVAVAMALSLAHALEWPGKRRLTEAQYRAVQAIYYPGFTIGGAVGEGGGILATLILLLATPNGTTSFWLVLGALVALLIMHLLYWMMTHPVNKHWVTDTKMTPAAERFISADMAGLARPIEDRDWTILRDRWEASHLFRAAFAMVAFVLLVTGAAL